MKLTINATISRKELNAVTRKFYETEALVSTLTFQKIKLYKAVKLANIDFKFTSKMNKFLYTIHATDVINVDISIDTNAIPLLMEYNLESLKHIEPVITAIVALFKAFDMKGSSRMNEIIAEVMEDISTCTIESKKTRVPNEDKVVDMSGCPIEDEDDVLTRPAFMDSKEDKDK